MGDARLDVKLQSRRRAEDADVTGVAKCTETTRTAIARAVYDGRLCCRVSGLHRKELHSYHQLRRCFGSPGYQIGKFQIGKFGNL